MVCSFGFHILCRLLVGEPSVLLPGQVEQPVLDAGFAGIAPSHVLARIQRPSGHGEVRTTPVPASDRRRTPGCTRRSARSRARKSKL